MRLIVMDEKKPYNQLPVLPEAASLSEALEIALAAMPWLSPADAGTVEMARTYARTLDAALNSPDAMATDPQTAIKALYAGPHLSKLLEQLGGTPAARGEFGKGSGVVVDPVEQTMSELEAKAEERRTRSSRSGKS
ncbi:hypothetical protein CKW39_08670 [Kocuria sp. WRN011]|nr:hypothetical protein CKW39_08670 [Kocuria sp. WRN011]